MLRSELLQVCRFFGRYRSWTSIVVSICLAVGCWCVGIIWRWNIRHEGEVVKADAERSACVEGNVHNVPWLAGFVWSWCIYETDWSSRCFASSSVVSQFKIGETRVSRTELFRAVIRLVRSSGSVQSRQRGHIQTERRSALHMRQRHPADLLHGVSLGTEQNDVAFREEQERQLS